MEDITQKSSYTERMMQLSASTRMSELELDDTIELIAEFVEQAYIAGANNYEPGAQPIKGLSTTGDILIKARNFVKFKGLRL